MLNNSLRYSTCSGSRPKHPVTHKISQFVKDQNANVIQAGKKVIQLISNCDQHSELRWLENVVGQMKKYSNGDKERVDDVRYGNIYRQRGVNQERNINVALAERKVLQNEDKEAQKQVKRVFNRKIKFQVINSKENKAPSSRKSVNHNKPSQKLKNQTQKRMSESFNPSSIQQHSKQTGLSCYTSKRKESVQIADVVTDPCQPMEETYLFKEVEDNLWATRIRNKESQGCQVTNSQQKQRRSAGKIVKNSNSKAPTPQSLSHTSTPSTNNRICDEYSTKKCQKVFIKLQTQNLSKYLSDSSVKKPLIETSTQMVSGYSGKINVPSKYMQTGSTKKEKQPQREHQIRQKKKNSQLNTRTTNSSRQRSQTNLGKQRKKSERRREDPYRKKEDIRVRNKSQQKRFNQTAKIIRREPKRDKKLEQDQSHLQIKCPYNISVPLDLKRFSSQEVHTTLEKININPKKEQYLQKEQKLMQKVDESQNFNERKNISLPSPHTDKDQEIQWSFNLSEDSSTQNYSRQHSEPKQELVIKKMQIEELVCSSIKLTQPFLKLQSKQLPALQFQIKQGQDSYQQALILLYKYLDEGKRNLLTSSNCRLQGLTEDLKILLSSIFNQIKAKKRAYSLDKFIKESKDVIKVKKQVYSTKCQQSKEDHILQILYQNLTSLNTKAPKQKTRAASQTMHIESVQLSNEEVRLDSQQIIPAKVLLSREEKINQIVRRAKKRQECQSRQPLQQICLQEPQLYFQKKYGINHNFKQNDKQNLNQTAKKGRIVSRHLT